MVIKFLKIAGENSLEHFGSLHDAKIIPRVGEFINILSNRFQVIQLEWFPLNDEIFVYIDMPPVESKKE